MNVEIRTEAEQFPEKEYINEIFVAVQGIQTSLQFPYIFYWYYNVHVIPILHPRNLQT